MTDDASSPLNVGPRWKQAPAYIFALFLVYVGVLTFLPDLETHFGGGWRWLYNGGTFKARCWGSGLALIGLTKIFAVEFGITRLRHIAVVAMFTAFVGITYQNLRMTGTMTPGTGIYPAAAAVLAWWMMWGFLFEARKRSGA
jgi:hypothetical protein